MKEVSKSTFHHLVCYYFKIVFYYILLQFPRWLSGKESTWGMDGFVGMQGMWVLIAGLGRSPGEGNGNSLEYSCLGNPTDRGT